MMTYNPAIRRDIEIIADVQFEVCRDVPTATAEIVNKLTEIGYSRAEANRMLSYYWDDPKARFHW